MLSSESFVPVVGVLITVAAAFGITAYAWSSGKNGTSKALQESNQALRDLLLDKENDWKNRFEQIEKQQIQNVHEIGELQAKVQVLEKKNGDMQSLILQSLNVFWTQNPDAAARVHMEISSGRLSSH